MRVMLMTQPSMRNYKTGLWHLEMDPNINKDRAWANNTPWDWCWFLPLPNQCSEESVGGIPDHVIKASVEWASNVQESRYSFPFEAVKQMVKWFNPDVIITETPEHVQPFAVIKDTLMANYSIVSYINYATHLPYSEMHWTLDSWYRQMEGCLLSDAVVFNTTGLMTGWLDRVTMTAGESWREHIEGKCRIWKAVYSPEEVFGGLAQQRADPPAIAFMSRLSDPRKNRHPEFFEAIRALDRGGHDFQVWIGDPNRSGSGEKAIPRVTRYGFSDRQDYINAVNTAAVIPCLWAQDQIYSIGYLDALAGGSVVIAAAENQGKVAGVTVPSEATAHHLLFALIEALEIYGDLGRYSTWVGEQLDWLISERSVEHNIEGMINDLEAVAGAVH